MALQTNKTYDLFIQAARHAYQNAQLEEDFDYPNYLGFRKAGNLRPCLIDAIQDALEHKRHGMYDTISERSFVEACLSECLHSDFYSLFAKKNQKLF